MRDRTLILWALVYALALTLSVNGSSLWTDEAFSAWLASHVTVGSFFHSLFAGDSSDLQMGAYYFYLFLWSKVFGTGEYALRAANIPFLFIFSFALIWTSCRVFHSRIAWVAPALLPFLWHYAGEARPYMAMAALGAAATAAVLGFVSLPPSTVRYLPWICLSCIFAGSCFDMLFLLLVPALALIAFLAWRSKRNETTWALWATPGKVFAVPFFLLALYFGFTFLRGTAYDYPPPALKRMASVLYELSGLSGFGPNRKLSLNFRPYLIPFALGFLSLAAGLLLAFLSGLRDRNNLKLRMLAAGVCVGAAEAIVLSVVLRKQIDVRHLAALIPLLLFILTGALATLSRPALPALIVLTATWMTADVRQAVLPEYQKEDYRDAIAAALSLHASTGADLALAADPVGAAYYGIDLKGPAPCYPIMEACAQALDEVPWPRRTAAWTAERWPRQRIDAWLAEEERRGTPVAILMQLDRAHLSSDWWPALANHPHATLSRVHGFEIALVSNQIHARAEMPRPDSPAGNRTRISAVSPPPRHTPQ